MVLEHTIEGDVVTWAEANGWEVRKMSYIGRRAAADRFFFGYGHILMIELKRPNGTVDPLQRREHRRLERVGCKVHVIDDYDEAIELLQQHRRNARWPV